MLSYLIGGNDAAPLKTDARLELSTHKDTHSSEYAMAEVWAYTLVLLPFIFIT